MKQVTHPPTRVEQAHSPPSFLTSTASAELGRKKPHHYTQHVVKMVEEAANANGKRRNSTELAPLPNSPNCDRDTSKTPSHLPLWEAE